MSGSSESGAAVWLSSTSTLEFGGVNEALVDVTVELVEVAEVVVTVVTVVVDVDGVVEVEEMDDTRVVVE